MNDDKGWPESRVIGSAYSSPTEPGYIPTIGEYAEVIDWLVTNPNEEVPHHMRKAYNDALERAEMRRFARSMEDMLDATEFTLGYRPPDWQMAWLNADFSKSDQFRLGIHAGRIRHERDDALTQRLFDTIKGAVTADVLERNAAVATAIRLTPESRRYTVHLIEDHGSWSIACSLPAARRQAIKHYIDEFYESSQRGYQQIEERWFGK